MLYKTKKISVWYIFENFLKNILTLINFIRKNYNYNSNLNIFQLLLYTGLAFQHALNLKQLITSDPFFLVLSYWSKKLYFFSIVQ